VQDEHFFRPTDVAVLLGGATKARAKFGWHPTSASSSWSK
jgi:GDP-D-mannose dehydratase